MTTQKLLDRARYEFKQGHGEAEAAGKINNCAARHYGAAMVLAELADDMTLLGQIERQYKEDRDAIL